MTSTSSTSSVSSLAATATSSKRLSGLVSGLDTDTLVKQLTMGTQTKIDKQTQYKQIASWQQASYREVIKALAEFKSKYFSSSTSSSSILSSAFFNSTSIKNTSSFLNVSGSASTAQNMVVSKISQLAKQASFSSTHQVSNGEITTGNIEESWTQNTIAGTSVTISYGGQDYAVKIDSDFVYKTTDSLSAVTDALNKSISNIDGLSGNVKFSIGTSGSDSGKVLLSTTGGKAATVAIKDGTENLLSGLGLTKGTTASTTTDADKNVVETAIKGTQPDTSDFFKSTLSAGSSLDVKIGGSTYTLKLSSDVDLSDDDTVVSTLRDALTSAISSNTDLKDKLSVTVTDDGKVSFAAKDGTSNVSITGGSQNMLQGLGLTDYSTTGTAKQDNTKLAAGSTLDFTFGNNTYSLKLSSDVTLSSDTAALQTALSDAISSNADLNGKLTATVDSSGNVSFTKDASVTEDMSISGGSEDMLQSLGLVSYGTSGMMDPTDLAKNYLEDTLAGSTLTFSLNGLSKNIAFNETDKSKYSTATDLKNYLQTKLDAVYGAGKVTVSSNDSGEISFSAPSDSTSVLTLSSSDKSGVLGTNGALHVYAGESNRINTNKTLEDVAVNLSAELSTTAEDGSYQINVNGKEFTFKSTDKLSTVINTINNDSDANVTISYSNTTNTFSAVAKNGGESSKVEISDVTGTLAAALFGTKDNADDGYTVQAGQDAKMTVSFDGGLSTQEITRSDNKFTLDDVNFELLATNVTYDNTTDPPTEITPEPIKFTVNNETDDLTKKITDFVTDYNNIIKLINGKVNDAKPTDGTYLPLTDDQKAQMSEAQITSWETQAKKGLLQNDSLLSSLSLNMRLAMTDQVTSLKSALYEIGISTKDYSDNGALTIDDDKLKTALTNNPDKVAELFTSSDGIATRLQKIIDANTSTSLVNTGLLVQKAGSDDSTIDKSTLAQNIKDYTSQITTLKSLLETQQEQYYNKFTKLEQYLSQMNSQSSWFSSSTSSDS